MNMTNVTFYYKVSGFDNFYKAAGEVRTSNKKYKILKIVDRTPISKHQYYKLKKENNPCFILNGWYNVGSEFHEIGYRSMIDDLMEINDMNKKEGTP